MVMPLMSNGSYFGEMQSHQILVVISGETKQPCLMPPKGASIKAETIASHCLI